jgi:hypothetical protein
MIELALTIFAVLFLVGFGLSVLQVLGACVVALVSGALEAVRYVLTGKRS